MRHLFLLALLSLAGCTRSHPPAVVVKPSPVVAPVVEPPRPLDPDVVPTAAPAEPVEAITVTGKILPADDL